MNRRSQLPVRLGQQIRTALPFFAALTTSALGVVVYLELVFALLEVTAVST